LYGQACFINLMKLYLKKHFVELGSVTCKEPIYIDVYYVDRKTRVVYYTWDFGMDGCFSLNNFNIKHIKGLKNKILADVYFDVGHAFFHYEGDPNYTYYHWALRAWLDKKVEVQDVDG